MHKALRLLATASLSGLVAFAVAVNPGCSGPKTPTDGGTTPDGGTAPKCTDPNTCHCTVKADCGDPTHYICTPTNKCVYICTQQSDCQPGQVCENAVCLPPACNDNSECPSGQQCVGGACTSRVDPTKVASCSVEPATAVLHAAGTKSFSILARDANMNVIPYNAQTGEVMWNVDAAVGTNTTNSTTSPMVVTGAMTTGSGSVGATVNGVTCTAAMVQNFAAPAANTFQVVVASSLDETPISGATVLVDGQTATEDSNNHGVYTHITPDAATHTVSVFKTGYSYVTVVGTADTDLTLFLKPSGKPGQVGNTMTPADFANLQNLAGTVHIAINGPSIAGNLIDLSLSTLLGNSVPTNINLGGSTQTNVNLPDGIVIGLGQQMFKGEYHVTSDPGLRTVWGLGGNVVLSDVLGVVSGAVGGGNVDIGAILTALLPVVGRLQSAVDAGVQFTSSGDGMVKLNFDTLLRIESTANVPKLPTYMLAGKPTHFDGAIVLAGALYEPQGLVPLGLTAGIDKNSGTSSDGMPDGQTDPVKVGTMTYGPGQLPLRFAPMHGGLEGSPQVALALAASFSGLIGGSSSGSGSTKAPLVLSGVVTFPSAQTYKSNATNSISFGNNSTFMNVPNSAALAERTFTIDAAPTGADLERLDVTGADSAEWQIYFPPGTTSVTIPAVPDGFDDRLTPASGTPTVNLQSVSLKLGTTALKFDDVFTAQHDTVNDLVHDIDAFSVRGVQ